MKTTHSLQVSAMQLAADYLSYMKDNFGITILAPTIEQHVKDEYLIEWKLGEIRNGIYVKKETDLKVDERIAESLRKYK